MSKLFQSRLLVGLLCIILAAAIAFVLLPQYYKSQAATESVVRVTQDIPAGSVITADMVTASEVGACGLPSDVLRAGENAVGMVASEKLYAGEYLTDKRLMSADEYEANIRKDTKNLAVGACLITIELPSASAGVAGVLRTGDTVDVYEYAAQRNEDGEEAYSTELAMSGVYVFDVLNRNMQSLTELDAQKEALSEGDNTSFDFAPAYVVVQCDWQQIPALIRMERTDALHLALTKAVS